ncbi:hypothetical protein Hdeb2414_s0007g00261371 [Helianthus debilis subsp. tardiflorus]
MSSKTASSSSRKRPNRKNPRNPTKGPNRKNPNNSKNPSSSKNITPLNLNRQKRSRKRFKCRYCSVVSTFFIISLHEPRCPHRFEHLNNVEEENEEVRAAKISDLKYKKLKAEIHKRGFKMGTRIRLKCCWDSTVSEVELGALAQQSERVRRMLIHGQLSSEMKLPCGSNNRSILISFCRNFDHNFNMQIHFPNPNWWAEIPPFHPWSLAVASKFLEIEPLLKFSVDVLTRHMPNTTNFDGLRRLCGFDYELDTVEEEAVCSILMERYLEYQQSEAYLERLAGI